MYMYTPYTASRVVLIFSIVVHKYASMGVLIGIFDGTQRVTIAGMSRVFVLPEMSRVQPDR